MSASPIIQLAAGLAIALQAPVTGAAGPGYSHPTTARNQAVVHQAAANGACADLIASLASHLDPATGRVTLHAHIKNRGGARFVSAPGTVTVRLFAVTDRNRQNLIGTFPIDPAQRHVSSGALTIAADDFVEAGSHSIAWDVNGSHARPYAFKMEIALAGGGNQAAHNDCRTGNNVDLLTASEIDDMFRQADRMQQRTARLTDTAFSR